MTDLLSYRQAAAAARMSYSSFYKLVADRKGPKHIEVQGLSRKPKIRFSREDLSIWLAARGQK